ncbi:MAG TPA: outer membrane beta-barrel protein [Hyphomicrobiaceae bacterium]|nr:outer membrane beta-barrel protein [Hyphomicrobiaceae bacterium]
MKWFKSVGAAFAIAAVASGSGTAPAVAHDHNWGGVYFGINAGWAGKDFDWAFNPPILGAAHQAYSLSDDGGLIGGHIGIQHQWNNLVVGVEAAYSGSSVFGNDWAREPMFGNNPAFDSLVRMNSIFTVGPRIGFAPNNQWLFFIGGGFASANVQSTAINLATGAHTFSANERHNGWYLGGGIEYAMTHNVILGVEYQHIDLGTEIHCPGPCLGAAGGFVDRDIDASVDVVRARLSIKLGRPVEHPKPMK